MATTTPKTQPELTDADSTAWEVLLPSQMGGIETHVEMLSSRLKGKVEVEAIVFNTEPRTVRENIDGVRVTRCAELVRVASNSISVAMLAEISSPRL